MTVKELRDYLMDLDDEKEVEVYYEAGVVRGVIDDVIDESVVYLRMV